jgi:putative molybdopterin biosynthesis protein
MDRWREAERQELPVQEDCIRFAGSHDLVVTWLAGHFREIVPGYKLELRFSGSLGGLMALADGEVDLAGCHLWDVESDSYNIPFVQRLFPGKHMALVNLAKRRLGLILPAGNPAQIRALADLRHLGQRFVNRQPGSGTRLWLDTTLHQLGIPTAEIPGYQDGKMTHSEVARAVAEGAAQVGIGLEAAALSYGLDFITLTHDRFDLVMEAATIEKVPVQQLVDWLNTETARQTILTLQGYDVSDTGEVVWVG